MYLRKIGFGMWIGVIWRIRGTGGAVVNTVMNLRVP